MNHSVRKALFAHALCKYDTFLFGFLASIIKPIFFPNSDVVGSLAIFATFASGYFVRPVGAIFFSHIGDRMGRKKAYTMTILFILLPALIIGVLPGYEYLGLSAPVSLILVRMLQGFGSGGEFSGVAIYCAELTPKLNQGLIGGTVRSVGFLATAIGTSIAAILTLSIMPEWGWRLAFILGACASTLSYYLRKNMAETQDFASVERNGLVLKLPLLHTLKAHKTDIASLFLISSCAYSLLYFSAIYINSLYIEKLELEPSLSLLISTCMMLVWGIITPLSGYLADRFGIINYLKSTIIFILIILPPCFYFYMESLSIANLIIIHCGCSICGSLFFGPVPALFKVIFPPHIRYTGTAFSNTLAQVLIGSLTPFYATLIFSVTHSLAWTGIIIFAACIMAVIGLYLCERRIRQTEREKTVLRDIIYTSQLMSGT